MHQLSIIITDDHPVYRQGMKALLKSIPEVVRVSEAGNSQELLERLKIEMSDIVFLDIEMPGKNGIETVDDLKRIYPNIKIVIVSMSANSFHVRVLVEKGVDGYLLKNAGLTEINRCIEAVLGNEKYYSNEVIPKLSRQSTVVSLKEADLSGREIEVLKLLCKQYSIKEISKVFGVVEGTIRQHRQNLYQKTGSDNVIGLIEFAMMNNLFTFYE